MKLSSILCTISAALSCHAQAARLHQEPLGNSAAHLSLTHDLISFHKNLTQIESITGNEKDVGDWLVSSLESQGYNVEKQQVSTDPDRFNVLAWPGKQRDARVLLSSHIDTVPPFYPYHRKDSDTNQTISGRGSVDAKGSVATQILAANELLSKHELSPDDIAMLYVVGEETGGDGMRAANSLGLRPETIIFGEPTEGKLASGHKGNLAVILTAKGKAAHSGYPWLGRSANEVLVKALAALMELGQKLPESDKYGVTTFNLGRIEGGVAANVVAQDAMANIAVRITEGTPAFIKKEIVKAVHSAVKSFLDEDMEAEDVIGIEFPSAGYAPVDIDADVPGFDVITVNYGTDIPNLNQTVDGQRRYLYGPGSILVAHSDHEMLTGAQLFDAVGGYKKLIRHALGH
ncbi:Zn-dependent exopeptidase [Hortaea werneckii]|nr:Zn-dependent exopeptidase [Hortaea werneckii]